jgi:tRNA modification GTPase
LSGFATRARGAGRRPNSGKSSLLTRLAGARRRLPRGAGTTRDVIEVPMSVAGVPLILIDTAGLREAEDEVEMLGCASIGRDRGADSCYGWVTAPRRRQAVIAVRSFRILAQLRTAAGVSARTGENLDRLLEVIAQKAEAVLPAANEVALNRRQRELIGKLVLQIEAVGNASDPLIIADELRAALRLCDALTGRAGVEQMLDALFGRFCLGK